MLARMKTILAAFVSIGFLAPAALACPGHDNAEAKTAKKDEQAPPKQATAPKPAAPPAKVAAPKATPKPAAPAPKVAGSEGKAGGGTK